MAKFKVGDTVKCISWDGIMFKEGNMYEVFSSGLEFCVRGEDGDVYRLDLVDDKNFKLVKGAKRMKEEKRNYIVVNSDCDNVEHSRLLTKDEAMEKVTSDNYYIIDISKAPRYTKKTTSRMVLQKGVK